jgi:hypothetical protein
MIARSFIVASFFLFFAPASSAEVSVTAGAQQNYVLGSGSPLVVNGLFSTASVKVAEGDWYGKLWYGASLEDSSYRELDITLGYTGCFSKESPLSCDLSANYYHMWLAGGHTAWVLSPIARVQYTMGSGYLFGAVEGMFDPQHPDNNGVLVYGGAGHALRIGGFFLAMEGQVGHDSSFGNDRPYAGLDITPSFMLIKNLSISLLGVKSRVPFKDGTPAWQLNLLSVGLQF